MSLLYLDLKLIYFVKEQLVEHHMSKSMEQSQGPLTIEMAFTEHAVHMCEMYLINTVKHFTVIHLISSKLYHFKVVFFNFYIMYEETIIC